VDFGFMFWYGACTLWLCFCGFIEIPLIGLLTETIGDWGWIDSGEIGWIGYDFLQQGHIGVEVILLV
jgi:hypothetical protein